jgi:hypothetical protein
MRTELFTCVAVATVAATVLFAVRPHKSPNSGDPSSHVFARDEGSPGLRNADLAADMIPTKAGKSSNQRKIDEWFVSAEAGDWLPLSDASASQTKSAMNCLAEERAATIISSITNTPPPAYTDVGVKVGELANGDTIAVVQSDRFSRGGPADHRIALVLQGCEPVEYISQFMPLNITFTVDGLINPNLPSREETAFNALALTGRPIWPPIYVSANENKLAILNFLSPSHYTGGLSLANQDDPECVASLEEMTAVESVLNENNVAVSQLSHLPPGKCFQTTRLFTPDPLRLTLNLIEPVHGSGTDARKILDVRSNEGRTEIVKEFKIEEMWIGSPPNHYIDDYTFSFDELRSAPVK